MSNGGKIEILQMILNQYTFIKCDLKEINVIYIYQIDIYRNI